MLRSGERAGWPAGSRSPTVGKRSNEEGTGAVAGPPRAASYDCFGAAGFFGSGFFPGVCGASGFFQGVLDAPGFSHLVTGFFSGTFYPPAIRVWSGLGATLTERVCSPST
jgi:hypothetical protein